MKQKPLPRPYLSRRTGVGPPQTVVRLIEIEQKHVGWTWIDYEMYSLKTMLILGWIGRWTESEIFGTWSNYREPGNVGHDSAAVLIRNGKLIAAIEEERLNRIKHSHFFPSRAIQFCLREAGAVLSDVDAIVTDFTEETLEHTALTHNLFGASTCKGTGRQLLGHVFQREFDVDVTQRLHFCNHHTAHAYSACYASGISDPLVVCLDGIGDQRSGLVARCRGPHLENLRHLNVSQSLGLFYLLAIRFIGFDMFEEYKVMGLAPYGNPATYRSLFSQLYQLLPNGSYNLATHVEFVEVMRAAGFVQAIRRKGDALTSMHKDFAAALQNAIETIVLHVLAHFRHTEQIDRLCLAGGVAHNSTMNGRIITSGLFRDVFIQPASHDAGNALGAAMWMAMQSDSSIDQQSFSHIYWGSGVGSREAIFDALRSWSNIVKITLLSNAPNTAAMLLAEGKVVGWVQGRSEFGPRALGNRSILADPRDPNSKSIVNSIVKNREDFRPFAPSVLEEYFREFFDVPDGVSSAPYMTFVLPVKPSARQLLPAVTHVDGSARVQTVNAKGNPLFYQLIAAFGELTGIPVVLNTSFNNNAEPIVDSVTDAIVCLLTTGLNCLIVGDWLVQKDPNWPRQTEQWQALVPLPAPGQKLVRYKDPRSASEVYAIEPITSVIFGEARTPVSSTAFEILLNQDHRASLMQRCHQRAIPLANELVEELYSLWQRRAIVIEPMHREK